MTTKMPHPFNVMGHFFITHRWFEKNNGYVCFKYKLQKLDLEAPSWWKAAGDTGRSRPDYSLKVPLYKCRTCSHLHQQVLEEWVCLSVLCPSFWKLPNGQEPSDDAPYSQSFLRYREKWPANTEPAFQLQPEPFTDNGQSLTTAYQKSAWQGMCCPQCACCSSRVLWDRWACPTPECGYVHKISQPTIPSMSASRLPVPRYDGHAPPLDMFDSAYLTGVIMNEFVGNYRVCTYELMPGNFVYHYQANQRINMAPGGPEELFVRLQHEDLGLKRHAMQGRDGMSHERMRSRLFADNIQTRERCSLGTGRPTS